MATQKGRLLLIRMKGEATAAPFPNLCGMRSKTMTINNNEVDVTTADCVDPGGPLWTKVMEGVKRLNVSGNGFFEATASEKALATTALSGTPMDEFEIVVPELGTFSGTFLISSYELGGEMEGGITSSFSLASSGPITFTAEP